MELPSTSHVPAPFVDSSSSAVAGSHPTGLQSIILNFPISSSTNRSWSMKIASLVLVTLRPRICLAQLRSFIRNSLLLLIVDQALIVRKQKNVVDVHPHYNVLALFSFCDIRIRTCRTSNPSILASGPAWCFILCWPA